MFLGVLRSTEAAQFRGGFSAAMRLLLRASFLGEHGLSTVGFLAAGQGPPTIMFAKPRRIIGDEAATKMVWDIKGASGLICCFRCKNCCSNLDYSGASAYLQHTSCAVFRLFDLHTDQDYAEKVAELARKKGALKNTPFVELQKRLGMNYNPDGVLADAELCAVLRPSEAHMFDSMHCALSDGAMNGELHLLIGATKAATRNWPTAIGWKHFRAIVTATWSFPDTYRKDAKAACMDCFNDTRRNASDTTFKATAKELLTIYPVLRYFAEKDLAKIPELARPCPNNNAIFYFLPLFLYTALRRHFFLYNFPCPNNHIPVFAICFAIFCYGFLSLFLLVLPMLFVFVIFCAFVLQLFYKVGGEARQLLRRLVPPGRLVAGRQVRQVQRWGRCQCARSGGSLLAAVRGVLRGSRSEAEAPCAHAAHLARD